MAWKILGDPFAILSRRIVASALIYGLTLTIRLTTSAGQDAPPPAPPIHKSSAPFYIMVKDRNYTFRDRPPISRICRNGCDRPLQLAAVLDCLPP
ncbi:hypothetical protein RPMA_13045 [Tardiphaga alba]|uniref:Secreted protein n=1 Tax=Tardiphaga alba TaxID=340268 RepID=A0ABX8A873_9BRAD|nr:hypothetical protein [Tardiphaga alba]QUS39662.1 hypothetical protein RPMA_13045 [Tardiphaga alba]